MSLADLPDVFIAHLTSYLEYEEVCNLMETSKKNYNAIKAYKNNKIKLDSLRFSPVCEVGHEAVINSEDEVSKRYTCKFYNQNTATLDNIENVLKECCSVEKVVFFGYKLSSNLSKVLFETKAKIGKVGFGFGTVMLDVREFVGFCQKFKRSDFIINSFGFPSNNWTDDVLIKLIEASTEIHICPTEAQDTVQLITDRTLRNLFQGKPYTKYFVLTELHNSFTIKELVNSLKILKESNFEGLEYGLGYLQSDQLNDAERYFNGDTGELIDEYYIENVDCGHYKEYCVFIGLRCKRNYNNKEENPTRVWFNVLHD